MNLPPGPKGLFYFFKMLMMRKKNPIGLYEELFRRYGDIVFFQLGPFKFAMLNDAEAIEQVLQTDSKNYTKSTGYERFKLIVGNGLLVSEGDTWKKQRRLMSWAFSGKHIEQIHHIMIKETQDMIMRWKNLNEVDIAEEMNQLTLQIISVSLFGKNQINDSKLIRSSLQEMLKYLQTTKHLWIQLLLIPLPVKNKKGLAIKIEKNLPFKSTKRFLAAIKNIDHIVHSMIEERKIKNEEINFLDVMINATDSEDQSQMTREQLRDEVVNMLIAGHETTANALTWTWHMLMKNPDVLTKVREEIKCNVSGDAPSVEEIKKLIYTRAVFEESMRIYPPFWRISRKNICQTTIKNYDIPAGTNIIASIFTVQRKREYWTAPLEFRPERFLEESRNRQRFAFFPFGGGARICIGAHFATIEAITILSICIKNYLLRPVHETDPDLFMSLTLQPKDGLHAILQSEKKA